LYRFIDYSSHTDAAVLKAKFDKCERHIEGRNSSVDIASGYGLDGPGIEPRCGARFSALV
jgi:hypothetical protein